MVKVILVLALLAAVVWGLVAVDKSMKEYFKGYNARVQAIK